MADPGRSGTVAYSHATCGTAATAAWAGAATACGVTTGENARAAAATTGLASSVRDRIERIVLPFRRQHGSLPLIERHLFDSAGESGREY
ncbi:hypothetical protein GCM10018779_59220 [Streptomyces griseocarneus]|nr:hypothetical protein GCM10018779_59220 [Streptomyces griseocarneus]